MATITCSVEDCTKLAVVGSPDGNYCTDHQEEADKNVETDS